MAENSNRNSDTEDVEAYTKLCKERQYARARLTRIFNKVTIQFNFESLTIAKRNEYLEKIQDLKKELGDINRRLHVVVPDDVDQEQLIVEEEACDEQITEFLGVLQPPSDDVPPAVDQTFSMPNKLKLPTIELPVFVNEKGESVDKFFHTFESMIERNPLSDYEQFLFLKRQLRKSPLAIVNSLELTEQKYASAKQLLIDAFACPLGN